MRIRTKIKLGINIEGYTNSIRGYNLTGKIVNLHFIFGRSTRPSSKPNKLLIIVIYLFG